MTGLTVPVDDPAALAAAAHRLLDEPGLRDRLAGAAAPRRAIREFDHRVMARRSLARTRALSGLSRLDQAPMIRRPADDPASAASATPA